MTDGPGGSPHGTPASSPFDAHGRLVGRSPQGTPAAGGGPGSGGFDAQVNGSGGPPARPFAGPRTATPPGMAPGSPGTLPGGAAPMPGGGGPVTGGRPQPLNWPKSGPISLGLTGQLTLTGGLSLGRHGRKKKQTVSGFDPVVRGRGLARLSRKPQPTTASELQKACVRWVVVMWAMVILLQRFQLPNQPIALLLPAAVAWCAYGLVRGVLELDRLRVGWWLVAAGVSAVVVPIQGTLTHDPRISLNSWGLLQVTFLVFVFRLRDRRRATYMRALSGMLKVSLCQAALVIVFLPLQFVTPYHDYLSDFIPKTLLLQDYTLAYTFSYTSTLYRSNGWIGLETSFTSIQLALAVIAALLLRKKLSVVLVLLAAIACTGAVSGTQMVLFGVAGVLFSRMRWALARYLVMVPTVVAFLLSPLGANTITRLTEGTSAKSSTGQRSTVPYEVLWPQWAHDPLYVLFGRGPGSSQDLVKESHVVGVIVPTPIKLFFDYGVIAGLALGVFLLFMFLGGPSRSVAIAMISSYWLFQPGTGILLVITIPIFITWWTPRSYPSLESEYVPSPNAAIVPEQNRRPRTESMS